MLCPAANLLKAERES